MNARVFERITAAGNPETLTAQELQLDVEPLTKAPIARPIRAWVRYGAVPIQIEGEAVAWTRNAVAVRWQTPHGQHRAWLWANSVEMLGIPTGSGPSND